MWQAIQTFVEQAGDDTDEDALFRRFESAATELGYPFYAFGALWGDPDAIKLNPAPAVRLNYPGEWVAHYFAAGYDKIDPVVLVSPYAQTSVTWAELRSYRPEFFDDAATYGLRSGIAIPLRAIQGCYVLCVASGDDRPIRPKERARLEVFAHGLFAAYQRLRQLPAQDHGLTANTVEVIRLSMAGLSTAEICNRLKLTMDGVHWCLKDARKKLKCANTAQVYLKAIQQGIVAVS
ncbi:autoinducer binding domain-containing protein (plasmid) [Azospirillum sp. HJ39]|uniref:helix-turn-helix transcriptional regulator n=1 Tax=Azospirillum sp. HJ39 TaxID=3159496 RepID=UPI00355635A1